MGTSNARKLKRERAATIEDEFFTVQTELNNMSTDLGELKFESLKQNDLQTLNHIRRDVQSLKRMIEGVQRGIVRIKERPNYWDK